MAPDEGQTRSSCRRTAVTDLEIGQGVVFRNMANRLVQSNVQSMGSSFLFSSVILVLRPLR
jgi:hypothetical protein